MLPVPRNWNVPVSYWLRGAVPLAGNGRYCALISGCSWSRSAMEKLRSATIDHSSFS
jgi:hypothetical protein